MYVIEYTEYLRPMYGAINADLHIIEGNMGSHAADPKTRLVRYAIYNVRVKAEIDFYKEDIEDSVYITVNKKLYDTLTESISFEKPEDEAHYRSAFDAYLKYG